MEIEEGEDEEKIIGIDLAKEGSEETIVSMDYEDYRKLKDYIDDLEEELEEVYAERRGKD